MESDYLDDVDMVGKKVGLCGYGSGAKAKVFEGEVQPNWRDVASRFRLFERLAERHAIDKSEYESLHRGSRKGSVLPPKGEFALVGIGVEGDLEGQRRYSWFD